MAQVPRGPNPEIFKWIPGSTPAKAWRDYVLTPLMLGRLGVPL